MAEQEQPQVEEVKQEEPTTPSEQQDLLDNIFEDEPTTPSEQQDLLDNIFEDDSVNLEPMEQEAVFEDEEDPNNYKAGSFADYTMQTIGGALDTAENMFDLFGIPQAYETAKSKVDILRTLPEETGNPLLMPGLKGLNVYLDARDEFVEETFESEYDKLAINIKGFDNYDPSKPVVYSLSDEEFQELRKKDKASFFPYVNQSKSSGAKLVRSVSRVITGLIPAMQVVDKVKKVVKTIGVAKKIGSSLPARVLEKTSDVTATGGLASLFTFKPYEPRLANDMAQFVQDTPYEILEPFFEWMQASDDNSELEERFFIALESVLLDATLVGGIKAFSKTASVFKRERKLLKSEAAKVSPEDLTKINDLEVEKVNSIEVADTVFPPSQTPVKTEARKVIETVKKNSKTPEDFVPRCVVNDPMSNAVV